jgi:hypothetical protein
MGTINLPPEWLKICGNDLCGPCCALVRDFIQFTAERAAALPTEPIEPQGEVPANTPSPDKLFETAPEAPPVPDATPSAESSTEEKKRQRKSKKTMQGQDAILPEHRPTQEPPQPPAGD